MLILLVFLDRSITLQHTPKRGPLFYGPKISKDKACGAGCWLAHFVGFLEYFEYFTTYPYTWAPFQWLERPPIRAALKSARGAQLCETAHTNLGVKMDCSAIRLDAGGTPIVQR